MFSQTLMYRYYLTNDSFLIKLFLSNKPWPQANNSTNITFIVMRSVPDDASG